MQVPVFIVELLNQNTKDAVMTRSELITLLAGKFPQLTTADTSASVGVLLDSIADALVQGDRVEIRGFGSFGLNHRPPRIGRNPKTGEKVLVPAKYTPHFKAGKEMRELVDAAAQSSTPVRKVA